MRPQLRPYQQEAVEAVIKSLETNPSTLMVMATGGGKTQCASSIAEHFLSIGRILFLAHRKELVEQGAARLQLVTGEQVDIEMAELWASNRARVVSASLDSIRGRLDRWPPDHFALIIGDEGHHFCSPSYKRVWEHFTGKKMLMTATPDRADEKALGQLTEDVAGVWDIVDLVTDGWLVPIQGRSIRVDEINLSVVGKTAGDLAAGELDEEMLKHIESIVSKTLELEPNRHGIWFFPGVQSAELAAKRIEAMGQTCGFVCGSTDKDERREMFKAFHEGRLQHISNCQLIVEGVDIPSADMIVMGRPTLSRAFFAQCAGRGLRTLPGLVDDLANAEERKAAIAASAKPYCVLVDFCGNAGKHTLITPEDLLGGDYSEEEVKLAKKAAKEGVPGDVIEGLEAARRELKAMMAKLQSKVKAQVQHFDPFTVFNMKPTETQRLAKYSQPATDGQLAALEKFGVPKAELKEVSKLAASKLLSNCVERSKLGLASFKQMRILKRHGVTKVNLSFRQASKMIDYIAKSNWRPDKAKLLEMAG